MAITFNNNFNIGIGAPIDAKYLNALNLPYTGVTQVFSRIPQSQRYIGLTVNVNNVEYWFSGGTANSNLVVKTVSGSTSGGGGTITGGTNGLGVVGKNICLGGTLINPTVICIGGSNTAGLEYGGNYRSGFSDYSLVDKCYVDSRFTGTTYHIPIFDSSSHNIIESSLTFNNNTLSNNGALTIETTSECLYLAGERAGTNYIMLGKPTMVSGISTTCIGISGLALNPNLVIATKGSGTTRIISQTTYFGPTGDLCNSLSYSSNTLKLGRNGQITVNGGTGTNPDGDPLRIFGGKAVNIAGFAGSGGDVCICGGIAVDGCGSTPKDGGDVYIKGGAGVSGGQTGNVYLQNLTGKTSPHTLYYNPASGLVSYGLASGGTGTGTITGGTNGIGVTGLNVCLGGNLTSSPVFNGGASCYHLKYNGDYSSAFTENSIIDKKYADTLNQKLAKTISMPTHGFNIGDVIGWSSLAYNKAIADGTYNGEILGVVSKCIDANTFELTQSGYIDGLSGLQVNKTYFLSDVTAGLMTTTEPSIFGHISKAVLIADSTSSGWVLPYAGYVVGSGGTGGVNSKVIDQVGHGFAVNDVVGWSGGTYNKAIANGSYNGEVLGLVTKNLGANKFELTQAGYVTGLSGFTQNATYFLSDVTAGRMMTSKPYTLGHVVKAMFVSDSPTSGWVLPYAGYLLTTGNTSSGITIAAGVGLENVSSTFNVKITDVAPVGYTIPVKINTSIPSEDHLFIDSSDIIDGGGTITGATNLGSGTGVFENINGKNLEFNSLVASGISTISKVGNEIRIFTPNIGDAVTGATNIGSGVGTYSGTVGKDFQFRSLVGSGNTSISQVGDDIIIKSTGLTSVEWGNVTGNISCQTDLWDILTDISGSTVYNLQSPAAICVGGVNVGYVLTGKTLACIIQDMLVPELFQTSVGTPSTSIAGVSGTYEVGCTLSVTITPSYNAGTVTPVYQTTSPYTRGGALLGYSFAGPSVSAGFCGCTSCNLPAYSVALGSNTWTVCTSYGVGACIKGSKGTVNPSYPTACPAGCTSNGSATLSGIYPYYYGKLTSGSRPAVTNSLITGGTKVVAGSTGTITVNFNSSSSEYTWLAIPSTSTSKTCWYVNALDNGKINTSPSDKYPDLCNITITSGQGCWANVSYKVYMSGAVGAITSPIEFRN